MLTSVKQDNDSYVTGGGPKGALIRTWPEIRCRAATLTITGMANGWISIANRRAAPSSGSSISVTDKAAHLDDGRGA